MPLFGPLSPRGFRRRGRRRGLLAGAAIGAAATHAYDKSHEGDQYASAPPEGGQEPYPPSGQEPESTELEELARLHEAGILTDEEFAAKKRQILGI